MSSSYNHTPLGDQYRSLLTTGQLIKTRKVYHNILLELEYIHENIGYPASPLLDLGCGSGITTFPLTKYSNKILAIDISAEQIYYAHQKNQYSDIITFLHHDMRQLKNLSNYGPFSIITAFLSFHYLPYNELYLTIAACYDLLVPGGRLIGSINNPFQPEGGSPSLGSVSRFKGQMTNKDCPVVVDLYNQQDIVATIDHIYHHSAFYRKKALQDSGFTNIDFFGEVDSLIGIKAQKK